MQIFAAMDGEARRAEIRRFYRTARITADKTQIEVETQARLDAGRYWKIENGFVFPTPEERESLARVLKVEDETELPSAEAMEARAS